MHVPSQPLMRSLLSQFQTPTAPRRTSRFFRVWLPFRLPCRANHPAYLGLASFISPILSAVDVSKTKQLLHRCQRNSQCNHEISVNGIVENRAVSHCPPRKGFRPHSFLARRHQVAATAETAFLGFTTAFDFRAQRPKLWDRQNFLHSDFPLNHSAFTRHYRRNCHETPSERILPDSQIDFLLWPGPHS